MNKRSWVVPPGTKPSRRQKARGQSVVEFALVLPLFVVILALAADFGRAFSAYIAVGGAAREGAVYGSIAGYGDPCTGTTDAVLAEMPSMWGTTPTTSCTSGTNDGIGSGYAWVEVTVNYTFSPIIPVGPIPDTLAMQRTVRMRAIT